VAKTCDFISSHYQGIDRDLLVTGAILHDVGKIEEFRWDTTIKYSDSGHLIGHIVSGAAMISAAMDQIDGFHPLLKMMVIHIILSHHGQKEFGSPKRPKSLESIILHHVEDLDAKVNTFQLAVGKDKPSDPSDIWTERNWVYDRPLFKGFPDSIKGSSGTDSLDGLLDLDYDPFAEE
jgi:3'-5' exoribonuclease